MQKLPWRTGASFTAVDVTRVCLACNIVMTTDAYMHVLQGAYNKERTELTTCTTFVSAGSFEENKTAGQSLQHTNLFKWYSDSC